MTPSPSLCPLFPSTIHICRLTHDPQGEGDESHQTADNNRHRVYGNLDMPLNSSRLPLNPDHIATQMRQQPHPLPEPSSASPTSPLRRAPRATRRSPAVTRTRTPPRPLFTPLPRRDGHRRGTIAGTDLDDTRRHGMILDDAIDPVPPDSDTLPSYSAFPSTLSRRVTADGAMAPSSDPRQDPRDRPTGRGALQRQWNVRWRTHPIRPMQRTVSCPLASEALDLPPPYAPRDPYPLAAPVERKPSMWARVVLYPFVPEGKMLDKAAFATDRLAKTVVVGVKKGVEGVGKKAKAVPKQIESTRAKRKIKWLEGRGYVDSPAERYACGMYSGAYHVVEA